MRRIRPESTGLSIPIPIRQTALWIEIGLQNGESIGRFNPIQRLCGLHFVQSGDRTSAIGGRYCTRAIGSAIASAILGGEMGGGARGTSGGARGRDFPPTRSHKAPRPLPGRGGADRGAGPRLPRPPKNTASELIFKLGLTGRCWVGGQLELLGGRQHELSETDWDCGGSQSKSGPTFIPDFRDGLERPETIRNQPEQRPRGNIYIPLL